MAKGEHASGASCGAVKGASKVSTPVAEKRKVGRPATNPKTIAKMERASKGIFLGRGRPPKVSATPAKAPAAKPSTKSGVMKRAAEIKTHSADSQRALQRGSSKIGSYKAGRTQVDIGFAAGTSLTKTSIRAGTISHGKQYEVKKLAVGTIGGAWKNLHTTAQISTKHATLKIERSKAGPLAGHEIHELHRAGKSMVDWYKDRGTGRIGHTPAHHLGGTVRSLTAGEAASTTAKVSPKGRRR